MMQKEKNFKLFSETIPVKGFKRSIIYDLIRGDFKFIPNELYRILEIHDRKTIKEIKELYHNNFNNRIEEYFNFLTQNEYIFEVDVEDFDLFPRLDLSWDYPGQISNTILAINNKTEYDIERLFIQCQSVGCQHIQIIFYDIVAVKELEQILSYTHKNIIRHIAIVMKYDNKTSSVQLNKLVKKYLRIRSVSVYNSPEFLIIQNDKQGFANVIFTTESLLSPNTNYKGIDQMSFTINIPFFTESQHHHTYFNRKLYIGSRGEIKNAPECNDEFGYIQDVKNSGELKNIIAKPKFQRYWNVHKNLCDVCNDCEFRHMCLDNRLLYQRKDGSWYHTKECNYNPYICKWESEENWISVEQWRKENPGWEEKANKTQAN